MDNPPRARNCLWLSTTGCLVALSILALLIGLVVLLAKFVWGLHLEQWL